MKRNIVLATLITVVSIAVSCVKDGITTQETPEITLNAVNPEIEPVGKTAMDSEKKPVWCAGDQVMAYNQSSQHLFTNEANSETASFKARIENVDGQVDFVALYPYSNVALEQDGGVQMTIPQVQNPSAGTFDGKADMLISKSFKLSATNVDVVFRRMTSVVKVKLTDSENQLVDDAVTALEFTVTSTDAAKTYPLSGSRYVNLEGEASLGEWTSSSNSVRAEITEGVPFSEGVAEIYLAVSPQTLGPDAVIAVTATTKKGKNLSLKIALASSKIGGMAFEAGKITTVGMKVTKTNCSVKNNGDGTWTFRIDGEKLAGGYDRPYIKDATARKLGRFAWKFSDVNLSDNAQIQLRAFPKVCKWDGYDVVIQILIKKGSVTVKLGGRLTPSTSTTPIYFANQWGTTWTKTEGAPINMSEVNKVYFLISNNGTQKAWFRLYVNGTDDSNMLFNVWDGYIKNPWSTENGITGANHVDGLYWETAIIDGPGSMTLDAFKYAQWEWPTF